MISLNGSLRTCKVNTGYANKLESKDLTRFNGLPVWDNTIAGRPVC